MGLIRDIKKIKEDLQKIKMILTGDDEITELEKEYREYKFFADTRGMKLLADKGLVDEYNAFMNECENVLFSDVNSLKIDIPKPSDALEKFKNKFNKFF